MKAKCAIDYFYKAAEVWDEGDLEQAFALYLQGAKLGDISSQSNLAVFYESGYGTTRNVANALYWYKKAIALGDGDGDAALDFGIYLLNNNMEKNLVKSLSLFNQAKQSQHITEYGIGRYFPNVRELYD